MSRNAPEGDSSNGGLPHPYTLSLPANRAAATRTNEPGCRERIGTLNKRLIFSAFEKELCRAYDSQERQPTLSLHGSFVITASVRKRLSIPKSKLPSTCFSQPRILQVPLRGVLSHRDPKPATRPTQSKMSSGTAPTTPHRLSSKTMVRSLDRRNSLPSGFSHHQDGKTRGGWTHS